MNVIQSYPGGNGELIFHLHNLDIEDKHRLLIAHRQFTVISGITLKNEEGEEWVIGDWIVIPSHTARESINGLKHFHVAKNGQATTRVTFGEGMPLEAQFILPALSAMTELVSRTVDRFEAISSANA